MASLGSSYLLVYDVPILCLLVINPCPARARDFYFISICIVETVKIWTWYISLVSFHLHLNYFFGFTITFIFIWKRHFVIKSRHKIVLITNKCTKLKWSENWWLKYPLATAKVILSSHSFIYRLRIGNQYYKQSIMTLCSLIHLVIWTRLASIPRLVQFFGCHSSRKSKKKFGEKHLNWWLANCYYIAEHNVW
jgi:hypothetical protein